MIYLIPTIIPVSRGHSLSIGSAPLPAKIAISSLIISLILSAGFTWWELINAFDSKLEQIILTLVFLLLEVGLTCVVAGIF